jgi:3-oxoacyl-[acyl-carrier protein] reductase
MQKVVVITGASGGLGKEFVSQYLKKNFFVIGIDISFKSMSALENNDLELIECDLTNSSLMKRTMDKIIDDYGTPDIWINNAGIVTMDSFSNETEKQISKVMKINFDAPMRIMKKLIPLMENNTKGVIVNISSVAGIISAPILSSYCASKFALVGLTESVQQELDLKESPVKLILVCPGFIKTELIRLGSERGFPEHLKPFLSSSEVAVRKIIEGIDKGHQFIDPTMNGKLLQALNRFGPKLLKSAKKFALPDSLIKRIKS